MDNKKAFHVMLILTTILIAFMFGFLMGGAILIGQPDSRGIDPMYIPNPQADQLFLIAAEKSGTEISPITYGWFIKARNQILIEEVKECLGI